MMRNSIISTAVFAFAAVACKQKPERDERPAPVVAETTGGTDAQLEISVIGTNDVHGHVGRLAVFGGYLNNLRKVRNGVVVLDGGDMFQGTLESNPNEGAAIVAAFNALRYTAVAIGNHEFDFGPVGPRAVPEAGDDPQGALRARATEAKFPFLGANIVSKSDGKTPPWENVAASTLIEVGGVSIGIIGVTTIDTPRATISANVASLDVIDPASAIEREATALRAKGAAAVLVTAHAGAACKEFHNPHELGSCSDGEIFSIARRLQAGLVDVIVAGHTHAGVAHRVNGIAIIESFSKGRAFGRADLLFRSGVLKETVIFPPRDICSSTSKAECAPGNYEGAEVREDPAVSTIVTAAQTAAAEERSRPLGVVAVGRISRSYRAESALGNLFVDLMKEARPGADVAITNGGGIRADIPSGPITYGALFEAMPFDNRFSFVTLPASKLAELFEWNLAASSGILSVAGIEVRARCRAGKVRASLFRNGKRLPRSVVLRVVTSDFLASGGDGAFAPLKLPAEAIVDERGETIRDAMATVLSRHSAPVDPAALLVQENRRLRFAGERPVKCR